jgi:hypothetical protein
VLSVSVNGDELVLEGAAPAFGVGGAFAPERSFTGANIAGAVDDEIAALVADPSVSITIDTVWGQRTISATLEPGDPRTLESAALRLNEALAAQGYDVGVGATELSGGGASLRLITGASHSVRGIGALELGGATHAATLDPIDALTYGANPPGALRAAERASRGAAITEIILKDMDLIKKESTEFGKGGLDIEKMLASKKESGVKYIFIEQEEYASSPLESMKYNMDFLSRL